MSSEDESRALGSPHFWDERYSKAGDNDEPTHEWFRAFDALGPYFEKHLFTPRKPASNPRILHLGSGDSTIPYDLLKRGYAKQLCVDFSLVVVDLMKSRHVDDAQSVEWRVADVRDMSEIETKSIDVAFDKGTLDAMIYGSPWSPPDEVMENSGKYINEVLRVLKDDGVFLYVTYRQPHFVKPILNRNNEWQLEMDTMGEGDSFEYYGFILRKHLE
ncbi:S-adenosyl-L-methionine-dependent methyltransferase [Massariosphaeria phaeospora]|uniref:S-adenosyl-L-methionine-dependent methyltransferase n=1 Tax=Massariosphaeria phaeospora TaxID=100035 RepID=A0A7C8MI53_9PLEO|nr:S-adenosyl-L-methionine-dependent methyltransferase [Massariosphaeria phaeospora]